jgi:hypothetical protein
VGGSAALGGFLTGRTVLRRTTVRARLASAANWKIVP